MLRFGLCAKLSYFQMFGDTIHTVLLCLASVSRLVWSSNAFGTTDSFISDIQIGRRHTLKFLRLNTTILPRMYFIGLAPGVNSIKIL